MLTYVEEIHSVTWLQFLFINKGQTTSSTLQKKKKKATLWRIVWWRSGNHLIAGIFYVLHLVTGNVHLWLWLRDWNKFITNPGT